MTSVLIGGQSTTAVTFSQTAPLALLAGTCAVENRETTLRTAETLAVMAQKLGFGLVYKGSFDKANRTSAGGARGLGLEEGLKVLAEVKREFGLPILTDVHETIQVPAVAEVADVLQVPAFLARQTDLLIACGEACQARPGMAVNIKKGQFMAPADMTHAAAKAAGPAGAAVLLTERGSSFGYGDLVVDFRGLPIMAQTGWPVVFDVTHSIMKPSGHGASSTGDRAFAAPLARAAVAVGVAGLFLETHPNPAAAISDKDTQLPLGELEAFLKPLLALDRLTKQQAAEAC